MKLKKLFFASLLLLASVPGLADPGIQGAVPAWFTNDIQRNAAWLPQEVQSLGLEGAYQNRWSTFPADVQSILTQMSIPQWMIALVPTAADEQDDLFQQFRFMTNLAGDPPVGELAQRIEQLLIFGGAGQLPTPGDATTGVTLGTEGCTAAMAKYILAELDLEFPNQLLGMPAELTTVQFSGDLENILNQLVTAGTPWLQMQSIAFANLQTSDVLPGSLMIGQKPSGTHVFGWTRVPQGWGWSPGDKMAVGNTGLAPFGDRLILAQEYVTDNPSAPGELTHNLHGPINSDNIIYTSGQPDLTNPGTNVYAVQGGNFITVNFP